jgi:undecaprenyl-diphosphatase
MDIVQAITYGAVQGITEFLPISSTAHLVLLPKFMGWTDPGLAFDVALHLGTLVALIVFFWNDWLDLVQSGIDFLRRRQSDPLPLYIVAATIPGGIAGVLFKDYVENTLRNTKVISVTLIALALVLVIAELKGRRLKTLREISFADAMVIGVSQALALVPGVSRSGVTITAGLFRSIKREAAARFSFLLSAPIIAGAVAKELFEIAKAGLLPGETVPFVTAIAVSGIVGYASIGFLMHYLQTRSTFAFVYYRILLGIVVYLAF